MFADSTECRHARHKTERLRALRLVKEAADAEEKRRHAHRKSAEGFWDNIDTSGGPDACHPWTGETKWNHPPGDARFEQGVFYYEGCESFIATRVLCFATYGIEVPRHLDIMPLCGDHLCSNVRHMLVTPHGGSGDCRLERAVTVEEYFECRASTKTGS